MFLRKKSAIAVISLILITITVFLSACGGEVSTASVNGEINFFGNPAGRKSDVKASEKIASSETAELRFDKKTGAVTFYDREGSRSWNSLPDFSDSSAATLYVKVFDGERYLLLDSQANCADKNGIKYNKTDSGVTVTYTFTEKQVQVTLPVTFSLNGAHFEVSADFSECTVSEGVTLLSVSLLPYMGAVKYSPEAFDMSMAADWFLVPDGAGALIYTAVEDENSDSYIYSVYGKEYYGENTPVSLAAYGIRQKTNALSVCIAEGEENALIKVFRSNADVSGVNRIYPEFIITPTSGDNGKVRFGEAYNGKIKVIYEALSGDSADYIGVAASVRQMLVRGGFLSDNEKAEGYPFFVSVAVNVPSSDNSSVTSFAQAENLLTLLKGKGVNEINLSLNGMLSDTVRKNTGTEKISSAAGGKAQFGELCSYAASQQMNVFAETQLFSSSSFSGSCGIDGDKNTYMYKNALYPYMGQEGTKMTYFSEKGISRASASVLRAFDGFDCGIAVSDSGNIFADFSGGISYTEMTDAATTALSSVSVTKPLMLSSADMNKVRYADYIYNFSFDTGYAITDFYVGVPFIPAVLHSSVIYASTPANTSDYSIFSLLRSIEYGAMPHYLWCFEQKSDKYYENTLSSAVDFYLNAENELASLTSKRITDHYQYEYGVYCTEYEGGTKVYVNYNNYSVIIGSVAVMPYNFLRIG